MTSGPDPAAAAPSERAAATRKPLCCFAVAAAPRCCCWARWRPPQPLPRLAPGRNTSQRGVTTTGVLASSTRPTTGLSTPAGNRRERRIGQADAVWGGAEGVIGEQLTCDDGSLRRHHENRRGQHLADRDAGADGDAGNPA